MTGGSSVELLRDIQILFESGTASGLTDRQLLERFIHHRDPSAFEVLVLRHGPMVLRVCRNLLHDPNDAQDAFQATFLILVRRSGSIRRLDSVGSWLYGVACRAAARLRVGSARRTDGRGTSGLPGPGGRRAVPRRSNGTARNSARSCRRKCAACPRSTAPPWCSATGRV